MAGGVARGGMAQAFAHGAQPYDHAAQFIGLGDQLLAVDAGPAVRR